MYRAVCGQLRTTAGAQGEPHREDAQRQQVSHFRLRLVQRCGSELTKEAGTGGGKAGGGGGGRVYHEGEE